MLTPSRLSAFRPLLFLLVCLIAIGSTFSRPASSEAEENPAIKPVATVKSKTRVWLRVAPSTDWTVVSKIKSGTTVTLLDGPNDQGWYWVKPAKDADAPAGWVRRSQLEFDHFAKVELAAKLLSRPSPKSDVVNDLPEGTVLAIAGPKIGHFLTVKYGEHLGYTETTDLEASEGPATTPPPPSPTGEYWVDVNRSYQTVNLMIGTTSVATFYASMSRDPGDGFYGTATGTYYIYEKVAGLQYTPYAGAYFMYWAGFDPYRFNGFHSWTMDRYGYLLNGGWGPTAGCVATPPADALVIYNFVSIGTMVYIHW
jgi:L,D-transpeptidase catalytic domain